MLTIYFLLCTMQFIIATSQETPASEKIVEETQHAICNIATEEIQATANASITRQLKGVCHTDDMHEKLLQLEDRLMKKIVELQTMLDPHKNDNGYSIKLRENEVGVSAKNVYDTNLLEGVKKNKEELVTTVAPPRSRRNSTKSMLEVPRNFDLEYLKYNNTISDNEYGKTYMYYWIIEDVRKTLEEKDVFITSPHFLVKGTINYIKFSPYHLGSKYACLEFENLLPNFYKYRFMILNHYNAKNDLSSQLLCKLDSFAKMFRIPYDKFNKYIVNDSIIVKLLVYLDM